MPRATPPSAGPRSPRAGGGDGPELRQRRGGPGGAGASRGGVSPGEARDTLPAGRPAVGHSGSWGDAPRALCPRRPRTGETRPSLPASAGPRLSRVLSARGLGLYEGEGFPGVLMGTPCEPGSCCCVSFRGLQTRAWTPRTTVAPARAQESPPGDK